MSQARRSSAGHCDVFQGSHSLALAALLSLASLDLCYLVIDTTNCLL